MCSLFGLGLPELALILVAAVFLVGPEKLGELVKESGKTAGELADELKNVPTEFQKGMEQGETEARSRKAKPMKPVDTRQGVNINIRLMVLMVKPLLILYNLVKLMMLRL